MSWLRLALGAGLCLASGYFLVELLLWRASTAGWLKIWLGLGLGLGLSSFTYFAWRLAGLSPGALFFAVEILAAGALGLAWFALLRRTGPAEIIGPAKDATELSKNW